VDKELPLVERAEIGGLGVAQANDAEQFAFDWIVHRNGVRELLRERACR